MTEEEYNAIKDLAQSERLSQETTGIRIQADIARQFTIGNEQLTRIADALQKKTPAQQQREAMGNG